MEPSADRAVEKLLERFVERLGEQGYTVGRDGDAVERTGKSGATHTFDMVATRDDGLMSYTIAVGIAVGDNGNHLGLGAIFAFDDKCYDCGIRDKVVLAFPGLDEVAERFALNQRIRVFSKDGLEEFLATPVPSAMPEAMSLEQWHDSTDAIESLAALGYRIERSAKVKGRSGAEYTFDALATFDDGFVTHRLGIDEVPGPHVTLSRVSVFDAKSYDAGILEKILLTSGELTPEAKQFADLQRIRVVRIPGEVRNEAGEAGPEDSPPQPPRWRNRTFPPVRSCRPPSTKYWVKPASPVASYVPAPTWQCSTSYRNPWRAGSRQCR